MRGWTRQAVTGGVVAGIGGAVALACVRLLLFVQLFWAVSRIVGSTRVYPARVARSGIWAALKLPAYPFVGERALEPGFDPNIVLLGVVNLLVVSIGWGVLFGLLALGLSRKATIAVGILWGMLFGWLAYYVVLPQIGGGPLTEGPRLPFIFLVFVPYGLAMATTFLLWQRAAGRARAKRPDPASRQPSSGLC